jgi:hypothetical protein
MISLGVALHALGIVIFIEPDALGEALGITQTSGVVYSMSDWCSAGSRL